MNPYRKMIGLFSLILFNSPSLVHAVDVGNVQYPAPHSRIQIAVSTSPKHRVFVLDNPSRLVIDIKDASLKQTLKQPDASHPLFAKIRSGSQKPGDLRIVVDLKKTIDAKHFALSTDNHDTHQLVIDLADKSSNPNSDKPGSKLRQPPTSKKNPETVTKAKTPAPQHAHAAKPITVAIDAGHGGSDPGAHGPQGTEEKAITFAIAKKLAQLINAESGMKAVMVRKDDYYLDLRERTQIARKADADLFVSIHADAYQDPTVSGASVFTLSEKGASSEAAHWLANSENAADVKVGGAKLDDKDEQVASLLLNLSQSASQKASIEVANEVLKNFQDVGGLHRMEVQYASFMVLKSPDIPSILVETAFISNPDEEKKLLSSNYQNKMAGAIFKGIRNYFKQAKPVDSNIAGLKF